MPAQSPSQIVSAIERAFEASSVSAILVSEKRTHPRRFFVSGNGSSSFPVWIYIWTLTHGGGAARPEDEYRIQLTSVTPPLPENPNGPTLLLGYEPETGCFAGFDLSKHREFSIQSPSIQININALRNAVRDGFSFTRKGNDEIAIAFCPDNMLAYCLNSDSLHKDGANADVTKILSRVGRLEEVEDDEIESLSPERKRIVSIVARLTRDCNFRRKVTVAYDRMCCVTGMQMKLVDAAHILPVGAEGSIDEVKNGLCLSPTYHRAYDHGLIYLSEDFQMLINSSKRKELIELDQAKGIEVFELTLGREIYLPADRLQWPDPNLVRAANQFRKI